MRERKIETVKVYSWAKKGFCKKEPYTKKGHKRLMKELGLKTSIPLSVLSAPAIASASSSESVYATVSPDYLVSTAPVEAVPVNVVGEWAGEASLSMIATILDPVIQLLVAFSFPICSLVIVGSLFYLAFGNAEKCWSGVQRGALSFILIQLSPIFLSILRQIGETL